jgi:hypothetical protein
MLFTNYAVEFHGVIFFQEVIRLIVSSFEKLHDKSSRWYAERILILEIFAKVRLCAVLLDLECDALIAEMFQHFFKSIRYELLHTVPAL